MMEAVLALDKSVYFTETTRRYIPESCNLEVLDLPPQIQTYRPI
jgi:hypothetical protein